MGAKHIATREPTALDLFAGCGGFSLGLHQAGVKTLAAIDFDKPAVDTFRENLGEHTEHVLCRDLTTYTPSIFAAETGIHPGDLDIIIGGPPCQGFSQVRQRDGGNHAGERFILDPRSVYGTSSWRPTP